jgi:hypothetical protein
VTGRPRVYFDRDAGGWRYALPGAEPVAADSWVDAITAAGIASPAPVVSVVAGPITPGDPEVPRGNRRWRRWWLS